MEIVISKFWITGQLQKSADDQNRSHSGNQENFQMVSRLHIADKEPSLFHPDWLHDSMAHPIKSRDSILEKLNLQKNLHKSLMAIPQLN